MYYYLKDDMYDPNELDWCCGMHMKVHRNNTSDSSAMFPYHGR